MIQADLERLRAYRANINRYRRLLATRLSDLERDYIQRRLGEEKTSVETVLRLFSDHPSVGIDHGRTADPDMIAMLNPAEAFGHPMDVVDDGDLTEYEKRVILSTWTAQACGLDGISELAETVSFDDILDALHALNTRPRLSDTPLSGLSSRINDVGGAKPDPRLCVVKRRRQGKEGGAGLII